MPYRNNTYKDTKPIGARVDDLDERIERTDLVIDVIYILALLALVLSFVSIFMVKKYAQSQEGDNNVRQNVCGSEDIEGGHKRSGSFR